MDKEPRMHTPMAMGILEQIHTATKRTGHAHYLEVQLLRQKATTDHQYQVELANEDRADTLHHQLGAPFQDRGRTYLKRNYHKYIALQVWSAQSGKGEVMAHHGVNEAQRASNTLAMELPKSNK